MYILLKILNNIILFCQSLKMLIVGVFYLNKVEVIFGMADSWIRFIMRCG